MRRLFGLFVLSLALFSPFAAIAHDTLTVDAPWSRATMGKTGAIYLKVINHSAENDRLTAVASPAAAESEIHDTEMAEGIMRMRPVEGGVAVPKGETVEFAPGGLHIMLMGLDAPFEEGGTVPVTLTFERAGAIAIEATIKGAGAMDAGMDHGQGGQGHGHGD